MNFIQEQAKKEVSATKRVWRGFLIFCVVWWGLMGVLFIYAVPVLGIIFLVAAGYLGFRLWGKKNKVENIN